MRAASLVLLAAYVVAAAALPTDIVKNAVIVPDSDQGPPSWKRVDQGPPGWKRVDQGPPGWKRVDQGPPGWKRVDQGPPGWKRDPVA